MYPAESDMLLVSIKKIFVVGHSCYNAFGTGSSHPCSMNIFDMGFFLCLTVIELQKGSFHQEYIIYLIKTSPRKQQMILA